MNLGPMEIAIIAILIFALFGYKKLPDATRAVGRSLRIFKGEMKGMKDDDVSSRAQAQTVRAPLDSTHPTDQTAAAGGQSPAAQPQPQARSVSPDDANGSSQTPPSAS